MKQLIMCGLVAASLAVPTLAAADQPRVLSDKEMAQVKGSGIPDAPLLWDRFLANQRTGGPGMDPFMLRLYSNFNCNCHSPIIPR